LVTEAIPDYKELKPAALPHAIAIASTGVNLATLKDLYKTNANGTLDAQHLVKKLVTDAGVRQTIRTADVTQVTAFLKAQFGDKVPTTLTPASLSAVLVAAETIGSHDRMKDEIIRKETLTVLSAMAGAIMQGSPATLNKLDPKLFAQFMKLQTNSDALKKLIADITPSLPKEKAAMAKALLDHYSTFETVGADTSGAAHILKALADEKSKVDCSKPGIHGLGSIALSLGGLFDIGVVGKHEKEIRDFKLALDQSQCKILAEQVFSEPSSSNVHSRQNNLGAAVAGP
jgi:hypothetical protein